MKIKKAFSPITITIETEQDLRDLDQILYTATRAEQRWICRGTTSELQEKIRHFRSELGIDK